MTFTTYLNELNTHYQSGHSSEHTYRGYLSDLIKTCVPNVQITNEPTNVTDCGNPDYVITNKNIPIGFIEAKDIGKDLSSKQYKEQFTRYKKALNNLMITDYVYFQFFQDGIKVNEIRIANVEGNLITPLPENFETLKLLITDFCAFIAQTIKSPKTLAGLMAAKARLLENILERAITSDELNEQNSAIQEQYQTFKNILIHDLTPRGFADIYAQTLAYGMFAARLHDKSLNTFCRQEAAALVPKSNPFLRKLFGHLAGHDIDERIVTTVDNLTDVFRATDISELLKNFGKSTRTQDPIIHFYETFLAEYDSSLRKARGVWYTPEPIVDFIVRAVDSVLKDDFELADGLADTSKTVIEVEVQGTAVTKGRYKGNKLKEKISVHKVQVLDPATGTGTFLSQVIKHIHKEKFESMQGAWNAYVEDELIPRLNGFELLMASYSMAHLKLDMLLKETGYESTKNKRFNVFLTNSLEEHHPDTGTLFSSWLSTEANESNYVKRDSPVMIVLGNPPYSINSSNKSDWIINLLSSYKENLNERKINLDDDYIKFLRFGQYHIERNGVGILAFITNNSFIDGITHREMRRKMMLTFDSIYILDLHGSSKKQEKAPDGSADENVFDITQGVSINIFVKTKRKSQKCEVKHFDIYGKRADKYDFASSQSIGTIDWKTLAPVEPYYFFVPKDFSQENEYMKGFSLGELFVENNTGIQTKRDKFVYSFEQGELEAKLAALGSEDSESVRLKYNLAQDGRDWSINWAREDIALNKGIITSVHYHPFDNRVTLFTGKSKGFMAYPRAPLMNQMLNDNIALLCVRNSRRGNVNSYFVANKIVDKDAISPFDNCKFFPLYISEKMTGEDEVAVRINFSDEVINKVVQLLSLQFTPMVDNTNMTFNEIDMFDYIYGILYDQTYRTKYEEFLKIDFPRIPYPNSVDNFFTVSKIGKDLRELHLLTSSKLKSPISSYPIGGNNKLDNKIVKKDWELYDEINLLGRIWINETQYFESIPLDSWNLYIGGYQPAQKWLKDRYGRCLNFNEISHYQKIISSLHETSKLMKTNNNFTEN